MYHAGYWIRRDRRTRLAQMLLRFLALYAKCADIALRARRRRFPIMPKLHMMAHCAVELHRQAAVAAWVQTPLSMTNQIQEDFIGRPSRISRRANIRSLLSSLLTRSLVVYNESLNHAQLDSRGMSSKCHANLWNHVAPVRLFQLLILVNICVASTGRFSALPTCIWNGLFSRSSWLGVDHCKNNCSS